MSDIWLVLTLILHFKNSFKTSHSKLDHPTGSLDFRDDIGGSDAYDERSYIPDYVRDYATENWPYGSLNREMKNHPDMAAHLGRKAILHRTLPSRDRLKPFSYGAMDEDYNYASQSNGKQGKRKLNSAEEKTRFRQRKRHVGPHDEGGLQRLISTGSRSNVFIKYTTCMLSVFLYAVKFV